jgi:hypothetical protein
MHRVAQRRGESRLDGDSQMIRGSTFQNRPDEELRTQEVIFPFPTGPISIAEGETKSITMKGVRFSLSTPAIEPVTPNPKVLKVVGELNNGLGSNAFLIHFEDPLPFAPSPSEPPANPRRYELEYATANLAIRYHHQRRRRLSSASERYDSRGNLHPVRSARCEHLRPHPTHLAEP